MDKLTVLPRARREADNSAAWYDEHAENLGEKFLDDFEDGLNAILAAPLRHPEIKGHYRQRLMDGFPFLLCTASTGRRVGLPSHPSSTPAATQRRSLAVSSA